MKKQLVRIKENSKIFGVCTGLADYFDLEVSKIRIAWIISVLFFGTGTLLYIILALILKKQEYIDYTEINV